MLYTMLSSFGYFFHEVFPPLLVIGVIVYLIVRFAVKMGKSFSDKENRNMMRRLPPDWDDD